jgi:hypothetical protein
LQGYATFVEAALQRTLPELESDWRKYLQKTFREREKIYKLPASEMFSSREEFQDFMQRHGLQ